MSQVHPLLKAAEELAPLVREHALASEQTRRLAEPVARAFARAGLYRIAAPRSVDGAEADPWTQIRVIETISRADGASGWALMIGIETTGFLGAYLTGRAAREVLGDPLAISCGALNPLGRARACEGGYRVSGQWPFASGCHNASVFWGQCIEVDDDGEMLRSDSGFPRLLEAIVKRRDFEILDTWHVSGLRGSGSHDVRCDDVFVPHERITRVQAGPPAAEGALFRFPTYSRLAYNKAAVATGIARAALDHFQALARTKKPRGLFQPLRERPDAQLAVARAESLLRARRAWLQQAVDEMSEASAARREIPASERAIFQLACTDAVADAIRAVDALCEAAGTSPNLESSDLGRCQRDVRVVQQHIMVSSQWRRNAGRRLLGLESESPFF